MLSRGIEELLGRASGPLHLRLWTAPTVAIILAIRAGLGDAREGQPAFLWGFIANPTERRRLLHLVWKDIARVVILALVLDTVYQVFVLRAFHVVQAMIVVVVCAIVPYVLFRGLTTRLTRGLYKKQTGTTNVSGSNTTDGTEGRPESQGRVD